MDYTLTDPNEATDSPEKHPSRLMDTLGRLQDEVTILKKTTAELAKRLEPVTKPTRTMTIEGNLGGVVQQMSQASAHSAVVMRLQTIADDLAASTKELRRLNERLDL